MNVHEETLIKSLLSGEAGEELKQWKDSPELANYIQHLGTCGLAKLSDECSTIRSEQSSLLDQTKELAYKEYNTFIHTADCSKLTSKHLTNLEKSLSDTSSKVSNLHGTLNKFMTTSRNLLISRQLNSTTLSKHTQLLEILELAQLLDTCVRNSYYDEALEIIAYVKRLEKKHGHIPIINGIVEEVQSSSQQMLSQLLSQLKTEINLPQCLKIVGLLRTLDVFTESQLRIKFLQARDGWLTNALRAIPHRDEYQYLSKSMECNRVHLFDIVTHYKAIFADEETRFSSYSDQNVNMQAILNSWILYKVSNILALLRKMLLKANISGNNLEALMSQSMFFGQSLSRIGADFRSLLPQIFQEAAARNVTRDISTANHKFDESLSCFSLLDALPVVNEGKHSNQFLVQSSSSPRAPLSLLQFPPLGHYLNALVSCFNTHRQCCFTALLPVITDCLTSSLAKVVKSLVELQEVECSCFSAAEWTNFMTLCTVVRDTLIPHVNACLRCLYPLEHMSNVTGISVHQLKKQNFGQLDATKICEPLEPFLRKEETKEEDVEVTEELAAGADKSTEEQDTPVEDESVAKIRNIAEASMPSDSDANENEQLVGVLPVNLTTVDKAAPLVTSARVSGESEGFTEIKSSAEVGNSDISVVQEEFGPDLNEDSSGLDSAVRNSGSSPLDGSSGLNPNIEGNVSLLLTVANSGLSPSEASSGLNPLEASSGLNPLEASSGLNPLEPSGGLNPLEASSGLNPLEASSGLNPLEASSGLNPLEASSGLNPLEASSALNPLEASSGLNPLEASSGLNPLEASSGLSPLEASSGLNPLEASSGLNPLEASSGLNPNIEGNVGLLLTEGNSVLNPLEASSGLPPNNGSTTSPIDQGGLSMSIDVGDGLLSGTTSDTQTSLRDRKESLTEISLHD